MIQRLLSAVLDSATGRSSGDGVTLSVSDLATCPAKALHRLLGTEERFSSLESEAWSRYATMLGRVLHAAVEPLVPGETEVPVEEEVEAAGVRAKVVGRIDVLHRDTVVEIKSSTSTSPADHRVLAWLLQAAYYASVAGVPRFVVVVFSRCRPEMRVFTVRDPVDAAARARLEIRARARRVLEAYGKIVDGGDRGEAFSGLAVQGNWCRFCPFQHSCPVNEVTIVPPWIDPGEVVVLHEWRP